MDEAEQLNRLLEVISDAVFINTDNRIAYCNPALHSRCAADHAG